MFHAHKQLSFGRPLQKLPASTATEVAHISKTIHKLNIDFQSKILEST